MSSDREAATAAREASDAALRRRRIAETCVLAATTYRAVHEGLGWSIAEYVVKLGYHLGITEAEANEYLFLRIIDLAELEKS